MAWPPPVSPPAAGTYTSSVRQSSLSCAEPCGQQGPTWVAARGSAQPACGPGAAKRPSPTGGAAKGTPRKVWTVVPFASCSTAPTIGPAHGGASAVGHELVLGPEAV